MRIFIFGLLLFVFTWQAMAQDERFFRQLFSGEFSPAKEEVKASDYSFFVASPIYALDLDRDGKEENIGFVKKDNEDWLEIYDNQKKLIFSYRFENKGHSSELYKMQFKTLGHNTNVLLLYYYEGITEYLNFNATSRIYALTIDNNNLKTMSVFKGASFFDEFKHQKGHYHTRHYSVFLEDLNNDLVKELIVKYRTMSTVFIYEGSGVWREFN